MPVDLLRQAPSFQQLAGKWVKRKRGRLQWGGLWGSSKSLVTAALRREVEAPLLVVVADLNAAELALDDLSTLGAGAVPFPAREGRMGAEPEVLRERFHALDLVEREGFGGVLVAPLLALIQPVPSAKQVDAVLQLDEGMRIEPDDLLRQLVQHGFERVPALQAPGEVARRGDILDLFAPAMGEPLRLEFFDDELESLRVFDLSTQRTRHVLHQVKVPLAQDLPVVAEAGDPLPLERLPKSMRVLRWEPSALIDTIDHLKFQGPEHVAAIERFDKQLRSRLVLDLSTLPGEDGGLHTLSVEEYCRGVADGAGLLAERRQKGERIIVCCSTAAEGDRLKQILEDRGFKRNALRLQEGGLDRGFRIPECGLTILHHRELVPGHGAHRPKPRRRRRESEPLQNTIALKPGDLVVHAVHGLARFRGIEPGKREEKAGADEEGSWKTPASRKASAVAEAAGGELPQDVLVLEFQKGALLNVPASRVDLVERYIGAGGSTPELDRLGSGSFERRRRRVQAAVEDLAAEMLEVQAARTVEPGLAWPEGGEDQRDFEAAFPFEDTPDQAQGTQELHQDLSAPNSMDRLICGDVGYGKTELAARAAFRVVLGGHQVAILVPTTVLAEQHLRSFRTRYANFPVQIEALSRLSSTKERKRILTGLKDGRVDLVIGTHRLLSEDVKFKRLGLVVIDEEQRFGVRAKERFKQKRVHVDVLTLSATPIPRTLHQAMSGLRDITSLTTAPTGRTEVSTEIRYDDETAMITEAIRNELARGGQVFYVHNRVKTLERVAGKLRRWVPECRVVTGHGQMEPRELEKAMLAFVRGDADILCSTTIVESGLDIPNANTIFIAEAQNYGLADLHQLRGRVGRSTQRGYAYLLIPRGQPLKQDARRRLKAIEELRYLGAGFQVAMRDLEIRGAGNLLGPEQSGHIAAVGYETYRKLLAQAVARMKRGQATPTLADQPAADVNLGVRAALPPEYVPDEEARIGILREFDRVRSKKDVNSVVSALRDRFGPPPEQAVRLVKLFFLKHRLGALGLDGIQRVDDRLLCSLRDARRFEKALRTQEVDLRVITPRRAHWILPAEVQAPSEVLEWLYLTSAACRVPRGRGKSQAAATGR